MDRRPRKDTVGAEELEGLDLDGFGGLIEVLGEDDVCYLGVGWAEACRSRRKGGSRNVVREAWVDLGRLVRPGCEVRFIPRAS